MSKQDKNTDQDKIDLFQIISLVLSVYILGSLLVQTLYQLSPQVTDVLDRVDFVICIFFLYDFTLRFRRAESKLQFMKWGWIDLISSIPVLGGFQYARVIRIIRILRALRSTKILLQFLFRNRNRGTLATASVATVIMMLFSSIAMLQVEKAPNSNITTPEDSIWWAFTTVTTVGYGDKYPVTTEGRLVAALLMVCSVGLFGIFTGYVAGFFVTVEKKNVDTDIKTLIEEVRLLRLKVEALAQLAKDSDNSPESTRPLPKGRLNQPAVTSALLD